MLVFAGAGSGKTRVIIHRIGYLLSDMGVRPDAILALTFTKKAAGEMQKRIVALPGVSDRPLRWMGTFHSCMGQILRREARHLGYKAPFVIVDEDDKLKLVRHIINRWPEESRHVKPNQAVKWISRSKTFSHIPREQLFNPIQLPLVDTLLKAYQKELDESCGLDFDDLLLRPLQLFQERPDVLSLYQAKFKYIFVDEFQDTNTVQYALLKLLARGRENLCVVGDDDQSIYRWRGAEVENILRFREDFPRAQVFHLEQNYRSSGHILTAAQSVVRHNAIRQDKKLFTDRPPGEPCTLIHCSNEYEEARWIVSEIRKQMQNKHRLGNMAILYRTNAQSRVLEEALRSQTLPYTIVGGIRFYERKEIKDVLAYFQLVLNPRATVAFNRIINFPARSIGAVTLEKLHDHAESLRLQAFETIPKLAQRSDVTQRTRDALLHFHTLIGKYRDLLKTLSLPEWARALVDELGLHQMYKSEDTPEAEERWNNIAELLNGLSEFTRTETDNSLEAFLQHVTLLSDVDRWRWSPDAVSMMTFHSAKGLEFDIVFMTGLEDGLFPLSRSLESLDTMEEERRLFYVGATRAMNRLYLSSAQSRYRNGQQERSMPSRFLLELDKSCLREEIIRPAPATEIGSIQARKHPRNTPIRTVNETEAPFSTGQSVRHQHFGIGTVKQVEGTGDDIKVHVHFRSSGTKKLLVKYAKLSVL